MNSETHRNLVTKYEQIPYSYEKLIQNFDKLTQRITQQLSYEKIEPFIDVKMDSKKRQITQQICNQAIQQTSAVLQRQIKQQLEKYNIKQKLQKFDYMLTRNQVLTQLGVDSTKFYDPQEAYLDQVIAYLQRYKNKIQKQQNGIEFDI